MKSAARLVLAAIVLSVALSSTFAGIVKVERVGSAVSKPAELGNTFAIVIGVGSYADKRICHLSSPSNDAERMCDWLTSTGVTHINRLKDGQATRQEILNAIHEAVVPGDSRLIVYINSHTTKSKLANDQYEYHICPHDYLPGLDAAISGLSLTDIIRAAARNAPRECIIILEGAGPSNDDVGRVKSAIAEYLPNSNTVVCWAAGLNMQAYEIPTNVGGGGRRAGAFTHALMEELEARRTLDKSRSASELGVHDIMSGVQRRMGEQPGRYEGQKPFWVAVTSNGLPSFPVSLAAATLQKEIAVTPLVKSSPVAATQPSESTK